MEKTRPAPLTRAGALDVSSAHIAKAALRRLAAERLEPTPENYERAYRHEAGDSAAPSPLPARAQRLVDRLAQRAFDGEPVGAEIGEALTNARWEHAEQLFDTAHRSTSDALAVLIERIVHGLERGSVDWTVARRKESVHRVLSSSRGDARRLQQRLAQLVHSWDGDAAAELEVAPAAASVTASSPDRIALRLAGALQQALPHDAASQAMSADLARLSERLARDGATEPLAEAIDLACLGAERVLQHRHHLFDQLGKLCHELTSSLTEIAENDSWVKGQCEAMRVKIEEGLTARGVRAVSDMLHHARARHAEVKGEREQARDALKGVIHQMLIELAELGSKTGEFHQSVGRYAEVIEEADSLESLTGVVREMVAESRVVQSLVQKTQARLQEEHSKAIDLSERVVKLEDEMRRLSDEVSTDQLTQIANRRGLIQAFEIERARLERNGGHLSIGLLDIDNFKRLNDELGHSAGDEALKSLAGIVSKTLRPTDRVARYGGEEFVVLLPETPASEGEQILTRLQRSLTGGLFMHKDKQVFVTFSAGVTGYRLEERIEDSLERADQALYEAKRTGKNRTCIG
ncbi:MAG: GGDEF domain-containing protein [Pseudomonadota bacterium]|nr:GGDEF domain-containing protein [Pseudomonadota bacterium]